MKIEWSDVRTALRTAGALIVGNSFVAPVILKSQGHVEWALLLGGFVLILIMSAKGK
jgi:hypothetical protein